MARRLRLQYPGARYHVINRGNLQHDVFATAGAKHAFIVALGEAAVHFGWRAKCLRDAENSAKGAEWKVAIAGNLRQSVAAPYRWIAETLNMGHPGSVRGHVARLNQRSAD